ncbi:MAG: hypothetical protein L6Q76_21055 [Polyangiaceae bacterium]|nr:hypothetical protein [Polyangiaceae bacterium]
MDLCLNRPIPIIAAGAASALGFSWRGLYQAIVEGSAPFTEPSELRASHPGVLASEVPPIPAAADAGDARQRKLMSRAARLAAVAAKPALIEAKIATPRNDIGFFLGVGASGGSMSDLLSVLRASIDGDRVSLAKLGDTGLSATNPVGTFQLLNNFTLCHSAMIEGTTGPNGAFFSRGGGTVFALMEALRSLEEGDCDRAVAGGADSALHPVTWAELVREGYAEQGYVLGEGAAVLVLATNAENPIAFLEGCSLHWAGGPRARGAPDLNDLEISLGEEAERSEHGVDLVMLAPWGGESRTALRSLARDLFPRAKTLDATARFGDSLAGSPAIAWAAALDGIASGSARRALIVSAGIDGQVGSVRISAESSACGARRDRLCREP